MKVLFLDIDGVLNSQRTYLAFGGYPHGYDAKNLAMLDPVGLTLIRRIVKASGASVVLSSSWRIIHDWFELGNALDLPIMGKTPHGSPNGHERGHQIADWLADHIEVTHYAIVDDDSDMLEHQKPYFVHTSGFDGFTWANAEKLAKVLGIDVWDAGSKLDRAEQEAA